MNYRVAGLEPEEVLTRVAESGIAVMRRSASLLSLGQDDGMIELDCEPDSPSDGEGIWSPGEGDAISQDWLRGQYYKFHIKRGHNGPGLLARMGFPSWGWLDTTGGMIVPTGKGMESGFGKECKEDSGVAEVEEEGEDGALSDDDSSHDDDDDQEKREEKRSEGEHVVIDMEASDSQPASSATRIQWRRMVERFNRLIDGSGSRQIGSSEECRREYSLFRDSPSIWAWMRTYDELTSEMASGNVFFGFKEGPITFPPSFRWRPRTIGGAFDRVSI